MRAIRSYLIPSSGRRANSSAVVALGRQPTSVGRNQVDGGHERALAATFVGPGDGPASDRAFGTSLR